MHFILKKLFRNFYKVLISISIESNIELFYIFDLSIDDEQLLVNEQFLVNRKSIV